jgi:hypothetical protein
VPQLSDKTVALGAVLLCDSGRVAGFAVVFAGLLGACIHCHVPLTLRIWRSVCSTCTKSSASAMTASMSL